MISKWELYVFFNIMTFAQQPSFMRKQIIFPESHCVVHSRELDVLPRPGFSEAQRCTSEKALVCSAEKQQFIHFVGQTADARQIYWKEGSLNFPRSERSGMFPIPSPYKPQWELLPLQLKALEHVPVAKWIVESQMFLPGECNERARAQNTEAATSCTILLCVFATWGCYSAVPPHSMWTAHTEALHYVHYALPLCFQSLPFQCCLYGFTHYLSLKSDLFSNKWRH